MNHAADLWNRIENRLTTDMPQWREEVQDLGQVPAVQERATGRRWTDNEVFKGLILAVLSNNTDWAKVKRIIPELSSVFHGFCLREYASLTPADIGLRFIPWFKERRAGSQSLGSGLKYAIDAARRLLELKAKYGSLDRYFGDLHQERKGDAILVAHALGSTSSVHKLPGLRIPLAAEFLKNIGFDVAKPDRHMNRAAGCFGWVQFHNWPDRNSTKQPRVNESEILQVMRAAAEFASDLGQLVCFVDNSVWLLCAKSGLYLSNRALCALSGNDFALPGCIAGEDVLASQDRPIDEASQPHSCAEGSMPQEGDIFRGTVHNKSQYDKEGWRSREISFLKHEISHGRKYAYPTQGDGIVLIDTDGDRYELNFSKPEREHRVCLGTPGQLKPWYQKNRRIGPRAWIYFRYTGQGKEFSILTEEEYRETCRK